MQIILIHILKLSISGKHNILCEMFENEYKFTFVMAPDI